MMPAGLENAMVVNSAGVVRTGRYESVMGGKVVETGEDESL